MITSASTSTTSRHKSKKGPKLDLRSYNSATEIRENLRASVQNTKYTKELEYHANGRKDREDDLRAEHCFGWKVAFAVTSYFEGYHC